MLMLMETMVVVMVVVAGLLVLMALLLPLLLVAFHLSHAMRLTIVAHDAATTRQLTC